MLINFPYIQRDSFVHRLDPRTKIILLFLFIFSITQSSNFWFVLVGLLLAIVYYYQARLTWAETKTAWVYIIALAVMLVVVNYFITAGAVVQWINLSHQHILFSVPFFQFTGKPPFFAPGPLVFSVESITFVLTQLMRNIGIGLFVVPVSYTIDPAQMGVAFKGMGISDKIAYAIDLSLRFLPSIARDFTVTYDAQRARGFEIDKLRGGVFGKIARLAPMIVPVIIGSVVDAEDIINAMELRCFGVTKRSWLVELHPHTIDRILIISSIVLLALVTAFNILGYIYPVGFLYILHSQGIPHALVP
ncbi:MAG TPA: energy-coupling factor transporter transmembrane component T [Ktedonobacteraceae bacterium]|jgi:energy-coupling factor transport system permease protein